jgi:hypothetical protein
MAAFAFKNIIFHELPDREGWQIIGVKPDRNSKVIATIAPALGEALAEKWANQAAANLAGLPYA